jgi:hypothetical protein
VTNLAFRYIEKHQPTRWPSQNGCSLNGSSSIDEATEHNEERNRQDVLDVWMHRSVAGNQKGTHSVFANTLAGALISGGAALSPVGHSGTTPIQNDHTSEHPTPIDIGIRLHSMGRVWRPAARGAGGRHTLDEAIGRSIIDRVSVLPRKKQVRLVFVLPPDELFDMADAPIAISAAIRADFARRRETAEHDLVRTRRTGWVSLLVAVVVLLTLMSLVEAIHGLAPPGRIATMLQEGFTIVAWVALWRPAELLLYDQWPIRSDIALLRRIETAEVHVVAALPIADHT